MANELTTTDPAARQETHEPTRWMTSSEALALSDRGGMVPFNPIVAAASFERGRLGELVLAYDAALIPTEKRMLADRLRALWNSTTASAQIRARDWLAETGRLLCDLPYAVIDAAIDKAVLANDRGFTPTVGQIRALAEPMVADLRRDARRLRSVKEVQDAPPEAEAADHPHAPGPLDNLSPAEILKRAWPTMAQHQAASPHSPRSLGSDPDRPCRSPSREDYLRMGVAAETLDRLEKPSDDLAAAA